MNTAMYTIKFAAPHLDKIMNLISSTPLVMKEWLPIINSMNAQILHQQQIAKDAAEQVSNAVNDEAKEGPMVEAAE